jgi:hypothetical protein
MPTAMPNRKIRSSLGKELRQRRIKPMFIRENLFFITPPMRTV